MKKNIFKIEADPIGRNNRVFNYNQKSKDNFFCFNQRNESYSFGINNTRVIFLFSFVVFCILVFWGRLFEMQVLHHAQWIEVAEDNRTRVEKEIPLRGVIYDRNGKILASNEANFVLVFEDEKYDLENFNKSKDFLIENLELNEDDFSKTINDFEKSFNLKKERTVLLENIEYDQALFLMTKVDDYPFLNIYDLSARSYVGPEYGLSHVLGYTGKLNDQEWNDLKKGGEYLIIDYVGKSGTEKEYEQYLRGSLGKKKIEIDAVGNLKKIVNEKDSLPGQNIYLTIDAELNKAFAESLCGRADQFGGKGAGLAVDPKSGQILAAVSCPAYDNNVFKNTKKFAEEINSILTDEKIPLYNRVIQGEYPPGSIFKLVVAGAALEEDIINERTSILSTGGISLGKWYYPDWKAGGHGQTNLFKAIYESVNTYFYYIGGGYKDFVGMGMAEIIDYARKFGLEKETGVDLPGERTGFLPTRDWKKESADREWYIGDTYHLSIGQGDLTVTPLQLANITSYYANEGEVYKPHVLLKTDRGEEYKNEILFKNIIDDDFIADIKEAMRQTVTLGSGRFLSDLPFEAGGKTGTAQVGSGEPHAWFTAFAPFDVPEIVVIVLIENGVEGSKSAVPVAKDVLKKWYEINN
jgi:penicillin-binding protein 2